MGILTTPAGASAETGLLIVVGGPQYRSGSHRHFTLLARQLAERGYANLRFDYRGMGDSEGDARMFDAVDEDISAAIDTLFAQVPNLRSIVLWGLCDAASAALMYAASDPRVSGLVLLNPWVHSTEAAAGVRLKHYYLPRMLQSSLWLKILAGKLRFHPSVRDLLDSIRVTLRLYRRAARPATEDAPGQSTAQPASRLEHEPAFLARMLRGLQSFRGEILFILSGNDLTAQEFLSLVDYHPGWRKGCQRQGIKWELIPKANHTFASQEWREQVFFYTADFINTINRGQHSVEKPHPRATDFV